MSLVSFDPVAATRRKRRLSADYQVRGASRQPYETPMIPSRYRRTDAGRGQADEKREPVAVTDAGSRTIDAVRVGRLLARVLVLVGGVAAVTAVAWIAGDGGARADPLIIDGLPGSSAPTAAVEMSPISLTANRTLRAIAVSPGTQKAKGVEALVGHVVVSSNFLDETVKSAMTVAPAGTEAARQRATTLDVPDQRRLAEAGRGRGGVTVSDGGAPASDPADVISAQTLQGKADHAATSRPSPRGHKVAGHQASWTSHPWASHPRASGHAVGKPIPPWSPMATCGGRTSLAVAGSGDHGSVAAMPDCAAPAKRIPLDGGAFGHQAVPAAVIQPGVRPG
ncbi:hypothetical protein [Amycolatopsis sp. NPDC051071]|uniref:hypothetical protein n=1 Tax=Amycolatopsis sp. NPDC051071 TaxID=3154637 RepID=UPI0034326C69